MYCNKCGTENNENSVFCSKCGNKLGFTEPSNTTKKKGQDKLFAGFLLNIFAVVVPALLIFGINNISPKYEPQGDVTIEFSADYSSTGILIAMIIGLLIFAVGVAIYFCKKAKLKQTLSIIYLVAAVGDLCLLVVSTLMYVVATCGLGVIMFIPGILQIVAGTKFVAGSRAYAEIN